MKIDLKRFGKWFGREAVPAAEPVLKYGIINLIMNMGVISMAVDFARQNGLPEDQAVKLAEKIRDEIIGKVSKI